jgi:hypothetical protein
MAKILENTDNPRRRRLDCPDFRRALEIGQTKRRILTEPMRRPTQRTFETMLTPLTVASPLNRLAPSAPASNVRSVRKWGKSSKSNLRGQNDLISQRLNENHKGSVNSAPGADQTTFPFTPANQNMNVTPFANKANLAELPNRFIWSGRNLASFFSSHDWSLTGQVGQWLSTREQLPTNLEIRVNRLCE